MQIFITGGTGLIGSSVLAELLDAGHEVTALARSERSAATLTAAGATPVRGSLTDLDVLRSATTAADGVIHLAFDHDFSTPEAMTAGVAAEAAALQAMGAALVGTGKPLVTAAATPAVPGRAATEQDPLPHGGGLSGRALAVEATLALAGQGVRSAAVRLPRTVHRDGSGGFAGILTQAARQTGVALVPGTGDQRWPAVHAADAARLFRLVVEGADGGTSWHAVAQEGVPVADMMAVIGRRLGVPVQPAPEGAFGPLGAVFALDQPASSETTRRVLGWEPTRPGLLEDLEQLRP